MANLQAASTETALSGLARAWQRAYAASTLQSDLTDTNPIAPANTSSRAGADALAAWQRWHGTDLNALTTELFSAAQWPWYGVLERARTETLASQHLPGMACNLSQTQSLQPADAKHAWLYLAARKCWGGPDAPAFPPGAMAPFSRSVWSRWLQQRPEPPSDQHVAQVLQQARADIHDGMRFAQTVLPLVQALAACHQARMQVSPALRSHTHATPIQRQGTAQGSRPVDERTERASPGYAVFDRQWDEEFPAAHWHVAQDDEALQRLNAIDRQQARQMAHRLQRRLQSAHLRRWSFDREEGRLDNRRLARLLDPAGPSRVFREESEAPAPEACVTLLVDQSGSMRGERQLMTALAIDLAAHTLQACHVRCEVLGYTTVFGADNPVLQQWREAGGALRPGRLNAVRHVVYKAAVQPWQRARRYSGLLLRESFGHENIDGEALHWAASRLARRPEARKILVVLSDGSPYDEATVHANGRSFLEQHLHEVVARIEASPIHLVAIGAGRNVGRYYREAITLRSQSEVARQLFERLAQLLTPPAHS